MTDRPRRQVRVTTPVRIRPERAGDAPAIHDLTVEAFKSAPFSSGAEASIVDRLRSDGDMTLSLVAVENGDIIGHVAFSPVRINGAPGGWRGLGPISVRPDRQRRGIGTLLIREGLARLRRAKASGCVLIGDPRYYARFGFVSEGDLTYGDTPTAYVQWLSLDRGAARGELQFAPAFRV